MFCTVQIDKLDVPLWRGDESFARGQLLHGFWRDVERGLYRGTLARDNYDALVDVAVAWPNAVRVARRKRPSIGGHAAERPRAVGVLQCICKGVGKVRI